MTAILVCIDGHPKSHLLVTQGFKKARETGRSLVILNVISPNQPSASAGQAGRLIKLLESAAQRGADVVQVSSASRESAILEYLETRQSEDIRFAAIIMGSLSQSGWLAASFKKDFGSQLMKRFGHSVEIVSIPLGRSAGTATSWRDWVLQLPKASELLVAGLAAFVAFGIIIGAAIITPSFIPYVQDVSQATLLLLAVYFAYRSGFLVAFLFAVPAPWTLEIAFPDLANVNFHAYWLDMLVLGFVSAVIAYLSSNKRASASRMSRWEERTRATYALLSSAMEATNSRQLLDLLERELSSALKSDVVLFLPKQDREDNGDVAGFEAFPPNTGLSEAERKLALACWNSGVSTGFGTLNGIASEWRFELMSTPVSKQGVIGVKVPRSAKLDVNFVNLLSDLSDHIAMQIAHQSLLAEVHTKEFLAEREHLRSMLLSSVSHDLKTPLASIIGSLRMARSLRRKGKLSDENAIDLENTAIEEAERLESFINNILSMTEIDSGYIKFNTRPCDPKEPLQVARRAVKSRYRNRTVSVEVEGQPYEVDLDPMLTAQVLQNLLENAAKYSPEGSPVSVQLEYADEVFKLRVRDHGKGIPEDRLATIFDKHERLSFADSQVAGTGLGLAIAKAVMEGQGGSISARNADGGGAEFLLVFPRR